MKEGEKEESLLFTGSLSKCLQQTGLGEVRATPGIPCKFPMCGYQEPKHLSHHLLSPRNVTRELAQE